MYVYLCMYGDLGWIHCTVSSRPQTAQRTQRTTFLNFPTFIFLFMSQYSILVPPNQLYTRIKLKLIYYYDSFLFVYKKRVLRELLIIIIGLCLILETRLVLYSEFWQERRRRLKALHGGPRQKKKTTKQGKAIEILRKHISSFC
jgi:hypothetical protein